MQEAGMEKVLGCLNVPTGYNMQQAGVGKVLGCLNSRSC